MSPLVDVTNTSGQPAPDLQLTDSQRKEAVKASKQCIKTRKVKGDAEDVPDICKDSRVKFEKVAINMCNTRELCGDNKNNEGQDGMSKSHTHTIKKTSVSETQSTDLLLSQAVETLSLRSVTSRPRCRVQRRVKKQRKCGAEPSIDTKNIPASNRGLPETPGSERISVTPHQCGACGLEFTSLTVLTQHLARHVYDGLYAAQWLTQAMTLVNSRQTHGHTETLGNDGLLQESTDH